MPQATTAREAHHGRLTPPSGTPYVRASSISLIDVERGVGLDERPRRSDVQEPGGGGAEHTLLRPAEPGAVLQGRAAWVIAPVRRVGCPGASVGEANGTAGRLP